MVTPTELEAEALALWERAQDLRSEMSRSNSDRLRDFSMLLGVQQTLPDDLQVHGGVSAYAEEAFRALELDRVALLRAAGHLFPDLHSKVATVPEAVQVRSGVLHGFPCVPQAELPEGFQQCVVCGMIWSLLNFYAQKDRGLESRCKTCKHEGFRRQSARARGISYSCQSEYAAVIAVFPTEGARERRDLGLVVHEPSLPNPRVAPPVPRRSYERKRKPVPRPDHPIAEQPQA